MGAAGIGGDAQELVAGVATGKSSGLPDAGVKTAVGWAAAAGSAAEGAPMHCCQADARGSSRLTAAVTSSCARPPSSTGRTADGDGGEGRGDLERERARTTDGETGEMA